MTDNLFDLLSARADSHPEALAVITNRGGLSFARLELLVWRCATRLSEQGCGRGSIAAVMLADELSLLVVILACARVGATCVTLAEDTPDPLLQEILASTRTEVVIRAPSAPGSGLGRPVIGIDRAILAEPIEIDRGVRCANPRAAWMIIVGSGSTGRAKLIAVGHQSYAARLRSCAESLAITCEDRYASLMHLLYSSPKERGLATLFSGGTLVLHDRRRERVGLMLARHRVTMLEATVSHVESLLRDPAQRHPGFAALRVLLLTASTVTEALRRRITTELTANLWIRYGTNESGLISMCRPDRLFAPPASVGTVHPSVEVGIVALDGRLLPAGASGELRVRGAAVVDGYLGDDAATRKAFRDGWFHPGDLARLNEDGTLEFLGRADQMMIFDGDNIYPTQIETVATSHPAVCDALAFPMADPASQDIPCCAIALHPGVAVDEAALHAFLRERLAHRAPRRLFFVEQIPRNPQGKPIRAELFARLRRAIQAREGSDSGADRPIKARARPGRSPPVR